MSARVLMTDRCDACGYQAAVLATKDGRRLLFCGHHGHQYRAALEAAGWRVSQDPQPLDVRPEVPARV